MRSPSYNIPTRITSRFSARTSIELYRRIHLVRSFEQHVIRAVEQKSLRYPVYLSTGQEAVAAALSLAMPDCQIFAQHRAHDLFLAYGGSPRMLMDELLGLPGGTSGGKAGSNCLQWHGEGFTMYGHHGLIGENVPQAVGAALGNGRPTLAVFGDGAAEEDYIGPSLGFAATHRLPVLFVCIDNDLSILTPTRDRRTWQVRDVAAAYGLPVRDLADDPWAVLDAVRTMQQNLPALINCRVCREFWHVGTGVDGPPEWDRYALVRAELERLGLKDRVRSIEAATDHDMEQLWND